MEELYWNLAGVGSFQPSAGKFSNCLSDEKFSCGEELKLTYYSIDEPSVLVKPPKVPGCQQSGLWCTEVDHPVNMSRAPTTAEWLWICTVVVIIM